MSTPPTPLAPMPLYVNADPKQLQQVFTNLVANGAEAMNDHGTITIATDEDSSRAYVVARVSDTGRGIPQENLHRVFEPFFTTKETGKGTGWAYPFPWASSASTSGSIDVESEVGRGTTVTILLPRVDVDVLEGSA
jgi:two-component system NtrC family sensor kinase